jgi:hypothetical protein
MKLDGTVADSEVDRSPMLSTMEHAIAATNSSHDNAFIDSS